MKLNRVILSIGQLNVGGTEGQLVMLAEGLRDVGVEVSVASLWGGGENERRLRASGIHLYLPGFPRMRGNPRGVFQMPLLLAHYVRWLREQSPQIVHSFLFHAYVYTAPAARIAGVPVIIAGRRSLGSYKDGRPGAQLAERFATRFTDLIVANSEAVYHDTLKREGILPEKVKMIHNGLSPDAFAVHEPARIEAKGPIILCVANFREYKGHRFLVEAAVKLHRQGSRFTLLLAGACEPSELPSRLALEEVAIEAGVDVRFLGVRTDIKELLAAADVFVLPSLTEGLSNSVLEAMAAGLPVVATDVGGNREALGTSGLLVPPSDSEQLAEALRSMLNDKEGATRLGREARARAKSLFSSEHMIRQHVRLYESLID